MYSNIYTSEVKSSWLHACNIFAEILQNTFVGNIMSKMLKWILEPLKSLICSEDTKNSHTTIY